MTRGEFSLVCYGGAGGLHAAELGPVAGPRTGAGSAEPRARFPAMGILLSDIVKDLSQSVLLPVASAGKQNSNQPGRRSFFEHLERRFARLEQAARAELRRDQMPGGPVKVERRLDIRYAGQSYELFHSFHAALWRAFPPGARNGLRIPRHGAAAGDRKSPNPPW